MDAVTKVLRFFRATSVVQLSILLVLSCLCIVGLASTLGGPGAFGPRSLSDYTYGQGYAMVGSDGGVFDHGTQAFFGSMGGQHLNAPMVGIALTPGGSGYWLLGGDGGLFNYGNAAFDGNPVGISTRRPSRYGDSGFAERHWILDRLVQRKRLLLWLHCVPRRRHRVFSSACQSDRQHSRWRRLLDPRLRRQRHHIW